MSWEIGVQLAHAFTERRIPFHPRADVLTAPYRDDNRYFWEFEEFDFDKAASAGYESVKQVRKYVSVMEMANEIDVETAGDDAEEIWVLGTELFPYEDIGASGRASTSSKARSRCPTPSTTPSGTTRSSSNVRPGPRCWRSAPSPATCDRSTTSPPSTSARSIA